MFDCSRESQRLCCSDHTTGFADALHPFDLQVVEEHEDENYDVGAVAMQGWRTEMVGARVADMNRAPHARLYPSKSGEEPSLMMVWLWCRRMPMWQSPGCGMIRTPGCLRCLMGTAAARCPASLRATW
jgi:hypothetical protein